MITGIAPHTMQIKILKVTNRVLTWSCVKNITQVSNSFLKAEFSCTITVVNVGAGAEHIKATIHVAAITT